MLFNLLFFLSFYCSSGMEEYWHLKKVGKSLDIQLSFSFSYKVESGAGVLIEVNGSLWFLSFFFGFGLIMTSLLLMVKTRLENWKTFFRSKRSKPIKRTSFEVLDVRQKWKCLYEFYVFSKAFFYFILKRDTSKGPYALDLILSQVANFKFIQVELTD